MISIKEFFTEPPPEDARKNPVLYTLRAFIYFVYAVVRGFLDNRCSSRAAALCYTTLLALVPLLAVVFSISKGFLQNTSADLAPKVIDAIVSKVAPQLEYVPAESQLSTNGPVASEPTPKGRVVVSSQGRQEVVEKIQSFIKNIDAGKLGAVGTVLLALVAVQLLVTVEQTFNDIWGVTEGRSIWRKVVYYWGAITLAPIVLLTALTVTGTAEFSSAMGKLPFVPGFSHALFGLAPYIILWIGFAFMYGLMPNTVVGFRAAVIGGFVGGTLWQWNNWLNAMYLSRVVTYSKIYGGLGILPVFLLGVYLSWVIILLGAQVSFVVQNFPAMLHRHTHEQMGQSGRELLACRIVFQVCQNFLQGAPALSPETLCERLHAPLQTLNQLARRLIDGGILVEVADEKGDLQPARPPESITLADVLQVIRTKDGTAAREMATTSEPVAKHLFDLTEAVRSTPANANFSDLIGKSDASSSTK